MSNSKIIPNGPYERIDMQKPILLKHVRKSRQSSSPITRTGNILSKFINNITKKRDRSKVDNMHTESTHRNTPSFWKRLTQTSTKIIPNNIPSAINDISVSMKNPLSKGGKNKKTHKNRK
jgi:hypothetical protein